MKYFFVIAQRYSKPIQSFVCNICSNGNEKINVLCNSLHILSVGQDKVAKCFSIYTHLKISIVRCY